MKYQTWYELMLFYASVTPNNYVYRMQYFKFGVIFLKSDGTFLITNKHTHFSISCAILELWRFTEHIEKVLCRLTEQIFNKCFWNAQKMKTAEKSCHISTEVISVPFYSDVLLFKELIFLPMSAPISVEYSSLHVSCPHGCFVWIWCYMNQNWGSLSLTYIHTNIRQIIVR